MDDVSIPASEEAFAGSGGTFAHENWLGAAAGLPTGDAFEYPLFTDARIVGEISLGPYSVLNAIADVEHDRSQAGLYLRIENHVGWSYSDMVSTDDTRYHGGNECDEIAALLSLTLGCRLKSGAPSRWFKRGGDLRGRPWSFSSTGFRNPSPPLPSQRRVVIPDLLTERNVQTVADLLATFPSLQAPESVALVRAARLYQDGVWVAESEPAISWLLLVSAIEVAANQWRSGQSSPRERMRTSKPALDALLVAAGGDALADQAAVMLADSLGATRKFVDFCLAFLPPPPAVRPVAEPARIEWTARSMKLRLRAIYRYRSTALHAGTPFPAPMCGSPLRSEGVLHEQLPYGALGTRGGIWRRDDLPMFLHTFEYIVRNALCAWWASMTTGNGETVGEPVVVSSRGHR